MNISKFRSSTETTETRYLKKVKINWRQQASTQIGTRSVWFVIGITIINTHILKVIIQKRARDLHTHTHTHTHTCSQCIRDNSGMPDLLQHNLYGGEIIAFYNITVPESHRDRAVVQRLYPAWSVRS